jgi:hypothetical protein
MLGFIRAIAVRVERRQIFDPYGLAPLGLDWPDGDAERLSG